MGLPVVFWASLKALGAPKPWLPLVCFNSIDFDEARYFPNFLKSIFDIPVPLSKISNVKLITFFWLISEVKNEGASYSLIRTITIGSTSIIFSTGLMISCMSSMILFTSSSTSNSSLSLISPDSSSFISGSTIVVSPKSGVPIPNSCINVCFASLSKCWVFFSSSAASTIENFSKNNSWSKENLIFESGFCNSFHWKLSMASSALSINSAQYWTCFQYPNSKPTSWVRFRIYSAIVPCFIFPSSFDVILDALFFFYLINL